MPAVERPLIKCGADTGVRAGVDAGAGRFPLFPFQTSRYTGYMSRYKSAWSGKKILDKQFTGLTSPNARATVSFGWVIEGRGANGITPGIAHPVNSPAFFLDCVVCISRRGLGERMKLGDR